jgi:hypothetical protein
LSLLQTHAVTVHSSGVLVLHRNGFKQFGRQSFVVVVGVRFVEQGTGRGDQGGDIVRVGPQKGRHLLVQVLLGQVFGGRGVVGVGDGELLVRQTTELVDGVLNVLVVGVGGMQIIVFGLKMEVETLVVGRHTGQRG